MPLVAPAIPADVLAALISGGGGGGTGDVTTAQLNAAVALLQDKATAATDSELAGAVSTINGTLSGKQDASTAATDAELASAVATINAAAATDTELASAVSTINTALSAKQDASTAATDAELASATAALLRPWTASTNYTAGQWVIAPGGYPAQRISTRTSGVTYDPTQWTEYGGGKEVFNVLCDCSGSFVPSNNTQQDVIQTGGALWQGFVPANSGAVDLIVSDLVLTMTTGTNAASVSQRFSVYFVDELNATLSIVDQWVMYGTGTSQSFTKMATIVHPIANSTIDKTYRIQVQVQRIGSLSASGAVNSGGIFPKAAFKAVRRS